MGIFANRGRYTGRLGVLLFVVVLALAGCRSGSTLRTARVLDPGCHEISIGVTDYFDFIGVSPVFIFAHGMVPDWELEVRAEWDFVSVAPRFQVLCTECHGSDLTLFTEAGLVLIDSERGGGLFGGGFSWGRQIGPWDPYLSYRYRYATRGQDLDPISWGSPSQVFRHSHHGRLGLRYTFLNSGYFVGAEVGGLYLDGMDFFPELGIQFGKAF